MTATASTPAQSSSSLRRRLTGRIGSRLFLILVAAWIIVVSFAAQMTAWLQASLENIAPGDPGPWWGASLTQAILIALPVLFFASPKLGILRVARYRAIFQSWAWAIGYLLLLIPTRLLPPVEGQTIILLQVILTLLYWLLVRRWQRDKMPTTVTAILLAVMVGSVAALPWLRWGALGSWLDLLLNGLLAVAFGLLLWTILQAAWIPAQRRDPRHPRRDRFTSGLVTGITLLIMASALSFNGVQVILMVILPAMGWAVVAAGATALATALVVALPLWLIDSDALVILASDRLLGYYLIGALVAMGTGWLLAIVALIFQADPAKYIPRTVAWIGALVALLLAGLTYFTAGQPGFYGDRIFVVLRDQADLTTVNEAADSDLTARRAVVYGALVSHTDSTQGDLRAALDQLRIGYRPYYLVNAVEVNGGLLARLWLGLRDDVAEIMPSPHLRPAEPFDFPKDQSLTTPSKPEWNLTNIGADRVWNELGVTGEGIIIGQSDSGVQGNHPEFMARYRGATEGDDYNWLDPWEGSPSPVDDNGHGTHTLGTILGESVGVAPRATWFACANLVRNLGNPAFYLECMQFMLAPFPQDGDPLRDGDPSRAADVLNNSWGCPADFEGCTPDVFAPAVDALSQAGIFVVGSAGNEGPSCSSVSAPPAIYASVLTVGAVDAAGNLANFSSVGPVTVDESGRTKPDVLAPGVDVLSAWPGSAYARISGTSMAGPHLAGTVALMWSANPALRGDVEGTRALIQETASPFHGELEGSEASEDDPVSDTIVNSTAPLSDMMESSASCLAQTDLNELPNNAAGYGVVDVYAAVQAALDLQ